MPSPKFEVILKKPARVIVENGGTVWYDEQLPAGTHEIKIDEIVPGGAKGKSTLSINGKPIAEIETN